MNVTFTPAKLGWIGMDYTYAAQYAFEKLLSAIHNRIKEKCEPIQDSRTIVVLHECPKCHPERIPQNIENCIFITPFFGFCGGNIRVHEPSNTIPHKTPGKNGEARTNDEYLISLDVAILEAIKNVG